MQQFGLLREGYLCLFGCWAMILLWGAVLIFVGNCLDKRNLPLWLGDIMYGIFAVLSYLNFQCVAAVSYKEIVSRFLRIIVPYYSDIPVVFMAGLYMAGMIMEAWMIYYTVAWNHSHITNSSIKEAVDTLPTGIVCYDSNGRIVFKNKEMEMLCRKMTGNALWNGICFEESAFSKSEIEDESILPTDDRIIRILSENEAWCFYKAFIKDDSVTYSMLNAVNISEEYEKTRFLENQKEAVRTLNKKLSEYHDDVILTIAAKEKLNAKIKIHDELGAGLLSIKRYLTNGASGEERYMILDRISGNIDYLKRESENESGDEYGLMLSTARELGVDVKIQGELPPDNPEKHIIATAIHECFTNTLRHADGDTLYVEIKDINNNDIQYNIEESTEHNIIDGSYDKKEGIYAVFTNNGIQPKKEIVEKGGLLSLRKLVEEAGGTEVISINPVFSLKIFIPKEKDEHGLQSVNS